MGFYQTRPEKAKIIPQTIMSGEKSGFVTTLGLLILDLSTFSAYCFALIRHISRCFALRSKKSQYSRKQPAFCFVNVPKVWIRGEIGNILLRHHLHTVKSVKTWTRYSIIEVSQCDVDYQIFFGTIRHTVELSETVDFTAISDTRRLLRFMFSVLNFLDLLEWVGHLLE